MSGSDTAAAAAAGAAPANGAVPSRVCHWSRLSSAEAGLIFSYVGHISWNSLERTERACIELVCKSWRADLQQPFVWADDSQPPTLLQRRDYIYEQHVKRWVHIGAKGVRTNSKQSLLRRFLPHELSIDTDAALDSQSVQEKLAQFGNITALCLTESNDSKPVHRWTGEQLTALLSLPKFHRLTVAELCSPHIGDAALLTALCKLPSLQELTLDFNSHTQEMEYHAKAPPRIVDTLATAHAAGLKVGDKLRVKAHLQHEVTLLDSISHLADAPADARDGKRRLKCQVCFQSMVDPACLLRCAEDGCHWHCHVACRSSVSLGPSAAALFLASALRSIRLVGCQFLPARTLQGLASIPRLEQLEFAWGFCAEPYGQRPDGKWDRSDEEEEEEENEDAEEEEEEEEYDAEPRATIEAAEAAAAAAAGQKARRRPRATRSDKRQCPIVRDFGFLPALWGLQRLRYLNVGQLFFSSGRDCAEVKRFFAATPQLRVLDARNCPLTYLLGSLCVPVGPTADSPFRCPLLRWVRWSFCYDHDSTLWCHPDDAMAHWALRLFGEKRADVAVMLWHANDGGGAPEVADKWIKQAGLKHACVKQPDEAEDRGEEKFDTQTPEERIARAEEQG